MQKPVALVQLIEELKAEAFVTSVETGKESKAVVYISDGDDDGIELDKEECEILFHSPSTVDRLMDALGEPDEPSLLLFGVEPHLSTLDTLERRFATVDEG